MQQVLTFLQERQTLLEAVPCAQVTFDGDKVIIITPEPWNEIVLVLDRCVSGRISANGIFFSGSCDLCKATGKQSFALQLNYSQWVFKFERDTMFTTRFTLQSGLHCYPIVIQCSDAEKIVERFENSIRLNPCNKY